ncbi:alpha/beta hydrolase [Microbacterium sp. NPDC058345]|uniref:alpha/beta hydrolase n=1 Tax=Microbacterium sp. NPDC058345 TaxID=3346455 RepID=UPI00364AF1F8
MPHPTAELDGLVRLYPAAAGGSLRGCGLVWAHGGGFVQGDLDMPEADAVARAFAARGAVIVSVDYRLVGDGSGRFPAGSDDILAAWSWTLAQAPRLGIDPARLVIGGASAGGNLVTSAVLRMLGHAPAASVDAHPAGVFLAYPTLLAVQPAPDAALRAALDADPEFDRFPPARVLSMYETYLDGPVTPDASLTAIPGLATPADVAGFPPTIVINDDVDELRVSGELFAVTLRAAGVPVDLSIEAGTTHGHLNRPDQPGFERTIARVAAWIEAQAG